MEQLVSAFLDEGHKVIATCRDKSKSQFQKHKNLTVENLDISSTESVNSLKKLVEYEHFYTAITGITKDNLLLDWLMWMRRSINTNLNGVFELQDLSLKI